MQNNSIHAIIRNNIAKKFKPLLQEWKFYELSYFQVVDGNALYRPIDNSTKIMLTLKTSIKEIKEVDVDILRHKFKFVDYNKIHVNMSSYQVFLYILCVILNLLIIMHYTFVIYENNYIHIFVMPRYHCKCDWCWTDWATLHQRIKCLHEKHKCHDYRVCLFLKKIKIIFNTCTFYLFIYFW